MGKIRIGIGQDSHGFLEKGHPKKCIVAGLVFEDAPGLDADSDGDVVFHAICNAITSITHLPVLGVIAPEMCHEQKITDSSAYLVEALKSLGSKTIEHVALCIEGQRPRFQKRAEEMRRSVADALAISIEDVGITFTTGDGLTAFGRGEGLQCFCTLTIKEKL